MYKIRTVDSDVAASAAAETLDRAGPVTDSVEPLVADGGLETRNQIKC